ncbi:MAG: zf-HC2 domain-containing protein [Phycisphaerales bacterium]|nr:MAG: zf-HC2 domain-containing protein [Phycisphaerales bacterium]
MSDHSKISRYLTAFALGELSQTMHAQVSAHLAQCPRCAGELHRLRALIQHTERIRQTSADPATCESAKSAILQTIRTAKTEPSAPGLTFSPGKQWRILMKRKNIKLAAAAIIVAAALGAVSLWPTGSDWWLQSPAAVAAEITASLETVEALIHREQAVFVRPYGSTHISGNWTRICQSSHARREDTYFHDKITKVRWDIPDGNQVAKYEVSYEFECYSIERYEPPQQKADPVQKLRFYVGLLEKAERILETELFEGRECVGFEIKASQYGNNPDSWTDRIWFDVETKLPVRIEMHGRPITGRPEQTFTFIRDQFEYYAQVPVELFTPEIPEAFVNKSASDVQKERDAQNRAQMTFADVPPDWKKNILAALQPIDTAVFLKNGVVIYTRPNAWRKDFYDSQDRLYITEWYCVEKDDMADTSLDFNDKNYRLNKTTVNYAAKTFTRETYGAESHPKHPMERVIFPIGWIDQADRILENTYIDGIECFGLELSANKYGTNPDTAVHTLWFDLKTNLPVRLEFRSVSDDGVRRLQVWDQFQWDPELPEDTFVPQIPAGFTLADPDQ